MTKHPFVNALAATTYITALVTAVNYIPKGNIPENSFIGPIFFLSLFVFSAAVMGYLFVYQPLRLFFENKQQEAVRFFLLTVASFAGITLAIVALWLSLSTLL
ncbi:MAG: hypothetical protein PHV99_00440 [Candidatus Pacebacteria bacterium]|nr:hypothetical protein [Candidatus Paceibacterota bacterium]